MNKLFLILFESFLIIISNSKINNFICKADRLKITPLHLNYTENENKRRLAIDYTPIKIGVDYSSFSQPSSMSAENFEKLKSLIESTTSEFQKFLKVQHTDYDLSGKEESIKKSCQISSIGIGYGNFLVDNDVVIFPTFNSEMGENEISSGKLCLTLGNRPRPTLGLLQINPNFNFNKKNSDLFMKKILFHEITHILVFDKNLLRQLGMTTTRNSRLYVNSAKVLARAKRHFNCASLYGLPLEDQEYEEVLSGSHWDARYMLGDYMIPAFYPDMVLSDITLSLFEDTRYYKVDYYSGGLFKYGKNKGCSFTTEKCIDNNSPLSEEFCTTNGGAICSTSRITKGYCIINDYINYNISIPKQYQYFENPNHGGYFHADFCPVADIVSSSEDYLPNNCKIGSPSLSSDYGEVMSDTSFCFVSSLTPSSSSDNIISRPMCYKAECNKETKQIVVHVGDSSLICPTDGGIQVGNGFKGIITCPKYYDICDTESNELCNDMFDCLNKKIEVSDDSFLMNNNISFDRYIPRISSEYIQNNYYIFLFLFLTNILF